MSILARRIPARSDEDDGLTLVRATIAAQRPPAALQVARDALMRAVDIRQARRDDVVAIIAAGDGSRSQILDNAHAALAEAEEAVEKARTEVRGLVELWVPTLRRSLAPHRADAARQIIAAVRVIERAATVIAAADRALVPWNAQPHPPFVPVDFSSFVGGMQRIADVEGS